MKAICVSEFGGPEVLKSEDRAMKFGPGAEQPHTLGRRSMRNVVCTSHAPNVIGRDSCQETERALQNIAAILKEAGSNLDKVLRCGVFLKNMNDFDAMNDAWCRSTRLPWSRNGTKISREGRGAAEEDPG